MASSASREPSVDELRRDAEVTRAHLTGTVEELRSQITDTANHVREAVAPATIKRQVTEYVRESGDNLLHSLQRRARENPLLAEEYLARESVGDGGVGDPTAPHAAGGAL